MFGKLEPLAMLIRDPGFAARDPGVGVGGLRPRRTGW